jgi:hypothetical protein
MALWFEVVSVFGEEPEKLGRVFGPSYIADIENVDVGAVLEKNTDERGIRWYMTVFQCICRIVGGEWVICKEL